MEQDMNIGAVGSAQVKEELAGESVEANVQVGPCKVSLSLSIDNKALLDLIVAKLPGGVAHSLFADLEAALLPK